ncbi:anti-sigma factor family protein [Paenibacillus apiarius]|uniref:Zf-HC2 domain-containing protein n=1 Tax=Paenibacillus apiarius TaxID=46240 RepID=A0ABT4DWQ2_9BACL|nr:zf-HC2 domain-containing protein [Paenibacillus apiarius]MCY9516913.1 zf-HC2 domain-containing protein [Paenibacillus apiarius]MCY9521759.1 zf-HC2 domain-containing protein [Paenibacillus apiarius]MCY9551560.1 zf-HC2 domain-containing protein [Paenibacillus apiarius]MCY9558715.1 zf-HC2 domain-containing protein [Paenibacillus apiarius]MCY9683971.1 zf-HC2 domain-containing protein [Paenibacillus apiarius]
MNCSEVMELIQRKLDHDLDASEKNLLADHVSRCPACAEMTQRLQQLHEELAQLPKVTPRFSLVDAIMPKLDQIDMELQQVAAVAVAPLARYEQPASTAEQGHDPAVREKQVHGEPGAAPERKRWFGRMNWRAASAVIAAGVVFGLFVITFKPPMSEQAGDFPEMNSQQQAPSSSDSADSTNMTASPTNERATPEPKMQEPREPEDRAVAGGQTPDDSGAAEKKEVTAPKKDRKNIGNDKPAKTPLKEEPSKKQPEAPNEPSPFNNSAGQDAHKGIAGNLPQDKHIPADEEQEVKGVGETTSPDPNHITKERDGNSMNFMMKESMEATSPDGKWMVLWENGQLVLYKVADQQQSKVHTLAFADTPTEILWSSDSKSIGVKTVAEDGTAQESKYAVQQDSLVPASEVGAKSESEPDVIQGTVQEAP